MLTYLIEDSTPKAQRILTFLAERFPYLDCHLYGSYHSGLTALVIQQPALLLLDMTIPNFDRRPNTRAGRLRALGGYELMRKLALRKIETGVIIVSQLEEFGEGNEQVTFSEIIERCATEFPTLLVGSVYFGQGANSTWQDELARLINSVTRNP